MNINPPQPRLAASLLCADMLASCAGNPISHKQESRPMKRTLDNETDNGYFQGYSKAVVAEIGEMQKQVSPVEVEQLVSEFIQARHVFS